jgi:hypothetical protein
MATGSVRNEARKDEDHAGDTDQVRQVLHPEVVDVVVGGVRQAQPVDDDVEDATHGHHGEAEQHQDGKPTDEPECLYHQHTLEIHPAGSECQVY